MPIVNGEPRVFMPLEMHRGLQMQVADWQAPRVETDVKGANGYGQGQGHGSPASPGRHPGKSPSFGRMMSWLGMGGSK